MPAWRQARRAGQQARSGAQAERAAPGGSESALPLAKERFKRQVCVYCGGNSRLKTGYLAITGPIFYCKNHAEQFKDDKPWEQKHKLSLGV